MTKLNKEQQFFLETLFKDMYLQLMACAQDAFRNQSLAEEAVQDTFQLACIKINDVTTSPNPNGWLVKALRFIIRNKKKKLANHNALFVSTRELNENIASPQHMISVEIETTCTEILGEEDYRLLKQVTLKEATIREAAQQFGLSEEACSKRVQRGKKKLRNIFEKERISCPKISF